MAEQRPGGFRFRLPWLLPSAPAPAPRPPQPTTTTQAPTQPTTMTPAVRPPFRPPGVAQAQPPPPQAQVAPRTESQPSSPSRADTQPQVSPQPASPSPVVAQSRAAPQPPSPLPSAPAPAPRPPQPTTTTQAPTQPTTMTPAVRPPFRPPGVAQAQPPPPQAQVAPRTESQPSSPSRADTQPQVSPQPASPSPVVAQSRAAPQPPSLLPSAPAPAPRPSQPTTTTQAPTQPTTMTPAVRLPFRPPGVAQAQPPPPQAQVAPRTESQPSSPSRADTQPQVSPQPASPSPVVAQSRVAPQPPSPLPSAPAPAPRPPQPTTQAPTQPTTMTPAVRPPFRPPGLAQAQPPPPQAQVSPRTESQPSSPSRAGTQPRASPQPASSSPVVAQPQAAPQPPSASLAAPQPRADSQGPSPSRAPPQSQSSPSRTTPQPQSTSQTASQPRSPSRLVSQPTGRASSLPSSPSITATKVQPTTEAVTQPPPPPKTLQPITQESSQPPPRSSEPLPISEKEAAKPALSQPQSLQAQPNGVATQPSQESGPVATIAPIPTIATETQKLDSSTISAEPKSLAESDGIPKETKERNEVQKTSVVTYDESKQKIVTEASQTKEQPSVAFQAPLKQLEKQETLGTKEVLATSIPNEKQAKTLISPPKDRSPVSESRQKPAISNEQRVPLHKEIRDDISKFFHKMAIGNAKHPKDEKPVSVITLAGENRGASMHLGSESTKREGAVHIHRGYKINPDDSAEATTDAEGSSKGRRSKDAITEEDRATKAYINSNIQGLNNSMLFNSSITERNPGVHLVLSRNLQEPIKSNDRTESLSRAEFNITPAQKLTYEPTVRRRCLRGLFMEPSDSDTDNPEKPHRHGCLYNCGEKNKDSKIDVL